MSNQSTLDRDMTMTEGNNYKFLKSALSEENPFISTDEVCDWLKKKNAAVTVDVEKVNFSELVNWEFNKVTSNLVHSSGQFFSIDGIRVKTNWGTVPEWEQPIINQPEIGYLGIITKEINGLLYFLLQAKIEPGNINNVQLSPTLQATKSNYTQVHGGKKPAYLEYFKDRNNVTIMLDQLQSEQGARFLQKRNRNIIILVKEDIPIYDEFVWLTLGQIKKLIWQDNLVNMDTRTVISGIPFRSIERVDFKLSSNNLFAAELLCSSLDGRNNLYSFDDLIAWLTELKCQYDLHCSRIPLNKVDRWIITDNEIRHVDNQYFKVIAAQITISSREVSNWSQPLIEPAQEGLIGFIIKRINGILHFLVQAKLECGNHDILELAPTVQCLTGSFQAGKTTVPFLNYFLGAPKANLKYDTMQSEEGGRFFREQNRNMIIEVGDEFSTNVPENFTWMTLSQLNTFIKFNNYLNIQARSLISAVSFI